MLSKQIYSTLAFLLLIFSSRFLSAQRTDQDKLIIFSCDFENNTVGSYRLTEWNSDWLHPRWANRQSSLEITADPVDSVNPTKVMKIMFPANSLGPDEGGTNWITHFQKGYNEIYLSYEIQFMPDFDFRKGGKLPSLLGGSIPATFERPNGFDGFTGGLMFKGNRPAFYIYYPDASIEKYGVTFEWGKHYFTSEFAPSAIRIDYAADSVCFIPGIWHNLTYRMVLNTVTDGNALFNGILEAWFDGKLVMQISHILFRKTSDLKIDCLRMAAFFGGADDNWRNLKQEWIKLDNIKVYTFIDQPDIPCGNILSDKHRIIRIW